MKFIINPKEIIEGFAELAKDKIGLGDEEVLSLSKKRMSVCKKCEHLLETGRCGLCGCLLAAKTRSKTSTCPDGRWKDINNES